MTFSDYVMQHVSHDIHLKYLIFTAADIAQQISCSLCNTVFQSITQILCICFSTDYIYWKPSFSNQSKDTGFH